MEKVIIYPNIDGGISIVVPFDSAFTVEEIALKDTPPGLPYKIINRSDIPNDRTFRSAWEADFSEPDGYGLGHDEFMKTKLDRP